MPGQNVGAERIPKCLILSLGVTWVRAMSLALQGRLDEALELVRNPSADTQRPMWDALEQRDKAALVRALDISQLSDVIFGRLQRIFQALVENRDVAWEDVNGAVEGLADE